MCCERGKKHHFQKGGGDIIFRPKYRPLFSSKETATFDLLSISYCNGSATVTIYCY
jgi:hypothetical protein